MPDSTVAASDTIETELLKLFSNPNIFIPIVVVIFSLFLCYFAYDSAPPIIWQSWLAFVTLATGLRLYLLKLVLSKKELNEKQKLSFANLVSLFTGIAHASSLSLFPYFTALEAAIQSAFFFIFTSSWLFYSFGYKPSFLAYSPIMLVSLSMAWFFVPIDGLSPQIQIIISGSSLVALLGFHITAKAYYKLFKETYLTRHEKEHLNQQLSDALNKAMIAGESKTRFLASASHDLRQPIHTLSLLSAAMSTCTLDEKSSEIASHMNTAIINLASQMDGLLDISKLDAGLVENRPQSIDLKSFIKRIAIEYEPLCDEKKIALCLDITQEKIYTQLDSELFERVIRNLLTNAIKYTEKGSITIGLKNEDKGLRLSISDTGRGIAKEDQNKIFDEFVQIENKNRERNYGLGLGLAIVKRLTFLMNLNMKLDSTLGIGTTVVLTLHASPPHLTQQAVKQTVAFDAKGKRILCIDDEKDVRDALDILLSAMGFKVDLAETTAKAMKLARTNKPDLILCDFTLGAGNNGIAAIKKLQNLYTNTPALLVTGDTHPARLIQAKKAGLEMVHKPVDVNTLIEKFSQLTQSDIY